MHPSLHRCLQLMTCGFTLRRISEYLAQYGCLVRSMMASTIYSYIESAHHVLQTASASSGHSSSSGGVDIMAAAEWPGVAASDVLLGPSQCRSLWRQFLSDSTFTVQQVGLPPRLVGNTY